MGFWNLPMPKEFAKTFTVIQHIVPSPCFWSLSAVGVVVVFNICMWLCCFVLYVGEEGKGVSHLLPTVTSLGWLHACLYFTSFHCNDSACTMYLFVNPQFQSEPMLKKLSLTLLFFCQDRNSNLEANVCFDLEYKNIVLTPVYAHCPLLSFFWAPPWFQNLGRHQISPARSSHPTQSRRSASKIPLLAPPVTLHSGPWHKGGW